MELMAHDPTQRKIKEPPSFDGFPNAFVTTFQVFIGGWTDVLTMQDDEGPPWKTAVVSGQLNLLGSCLKEILLDSCF